MDNIFLELTLVLIAAGTVAYILHFFKQPSIIAYIFTGLLIGPLSFYSLQHGEVLQGLAEIGITLLLFMVGLDLDISQLKRIRRTAIIAGLGQLIFTGVIGYLIALALGFSLIPSLYIAAALSFSSTIIVVKLLTEKQDMQSLYGKLAVGIFLVQDIAAILILVILSGLNNGESFGITGLSVWENITLTLAKVFLLAVVVIALSKHVFPKLLSSLAKSEELLLLFSLGWALGLAAILSSPWVGFNPAIGGFVAGLALANSGIHYQVSGRIKPLRNFFIMIFFIMLGSQLVAGTIATAILPALILAAFVLIGNPFIVFIILGLLGYQPRTSLFTGVTVAQISEFSLILMALGLTAGHVSPNEVTVVTLVGLATISISSYGVMHSNKLYNGLMKITSNWLEKRFGRTRQEHSFLGDQIFKNHIVVIGANRLGKNLVNKLLKQKEQHLVIDFDPDIAEFYREQGTPVICGDISDPYIQKSAHLSKARLVIATIPDVNDTLALMETLMLSKKHPKVITVANNENEALELYQAGASYVLLPHFIGGVHLTDIIKTKSDAASLRKLKLKHLRTLKKLQIQN